MPVYPEGGGSGSLQNISAYLPATWNDISEDSILHSSVCKIRCTGWCMDWYKGLKKV